VPALQIGDRVVKFKDEGGYIEFDGKRIGYSVLSDQEGRLVVKVGDSIREIIYVEYEDAIATYQNGTTVKFRLFSDRDLLLRSLSNEKSSHYRLTEMRAPMPGLVVEVKVKKGDRVKRGGTIAVLEAMKMENEIRVSYDSEVVDIFVRIGDVVEKDQVIVTLK